ncbi:FkbM family methyltransferase [Myxococcota bacterium]
MPELRRIQGHSFWDAFGPTPIVLDLGANVGKFATEFVGAYPAARMLLVEGDPYLVSILERTFPNRERVELCPALVGAQSLVSVPFHLCRVPEGNSVLRRFSETWSPGESREIHVPMLSLANLISATRGESVDLLKIDIEGSEWDLLEAFTEQQACQVRQLSVEFHDFLDPNLRSRTEGCIHRLAELGYQVRCRGTQRVHGSPYIDCLFFRSNGCAMG